MLLFITISFEHTSFQTTIQKLFLHYIPLFVMLLICIDSIVGLFQHIYVFLVFHVVSSGKFQYVPNSFDQIVRIYRSKACQHNFAIYISPINIFIYFILLPQDLSDRNKKDQIHFNNQKQNIVVHGLEIKNEHLILHKNIISLFVYDGFPLDSLYDI